MNHIPTGRMPYAAYDRQSAKRAHAEDPPEDRTPFQQDCDRVVHTTAFRRLMHKTQVFFSPDSDHVRTRLTHTIEVSRAARSVATQLGLNPELAECIALAHDLGHPPFGHAGEATLNRLMKGHGGFEHNAQALRIVTNLSRTYPDFDGLNLCLGSLEGIAKHNGPIHQPPSADVARILQQNGIGHAGYPSAEAQVAALADDIAYNCHDLQDALRTKLLTLEDVSSLPIIGPRYRALQASMPKLDSHRMMHALVRTLFGTLMDDLVAGSAAILARLAPGSIEDIRQYDQGVIAFTGETEEDLNAIRSFLAEHMYNTPEMDLYRGKISRLLTIIFEHYTADPDVLPEHWRARLGTRPDSSLLARTVADYISGMTDNFAIMTFADIMGLAGNVSLMTLPLHG